MRASKGNLFFDTGDCFIGSWQSGFFNEGRLLKYGGACYDGQWKFSNTVFHFDGVYNDNKMQGRFKIKMQDLK